MKNTNVKVQFVQERKEGETVLNAKPLAIESDNLSEIAGTITKNILSTRLTLIKYGAKIKGFSFNRKFNVRITINELEPVDLTDLFGLADVDCNRTLMVKKNDAEKTEQIFKQFSAQIFDLVRLSMTQEHLCIEDMDEVNESIPQKVAEVASPKLLAE